jgi:hypothetical protein
MINLSPEPHSIWVSTDIDVDIRIKPGSVPQTIEHLKDFSEMFNDFLIQQDATWCNYVLHDEDGKPMFALSYEFLP